MGRTKKQKAAAALDEPGDDDFTFLAVFYPVGRSGAPMTSDSNPEDVRAAERIGEWMHHAGLPIRKLFTRKREDHLIVEVRKEIPQDVIDSKLGAYKWRDMFWPGKVPPECINAETTILRAQVKSHDGVEKMGGMVYFPIRVMPPVQPGVEHPAFKTPFPKPKRVGYAEPSTFSGIKYVRLPPEFTFVDDTTPDVKPDIKPDVKPDVKPDIRPNVSTDVKPDIKPVVGQDNKPIIPKEESKPVVDLEAQRLEAIRNIPDLYPEDDTKPVVPKEEQKPFVDLEAQRMEAIRQIPNLYPEDDAKPVVPQAEYKPTQDELDAEQRRIAISQIPNLYPDAPDEKPAINKEENQADEHALVGDVGSNANHDVQPPLVDTHHEVRVKGEVLEQNPGAAQDQPAEAEIANQSVNIAPAGSPNGQIKREPSSTNGEEPAQTRLKRAAEDLGEREQGVKRERLEV